MWPLRLTASSMSNFPSCRQAGYLYQDILIQPCHATIVWSGCACWLNRECLGGSLECDLLFKKARIVTCPRGTVILIHLPLKRCARYLIEKHLLFKCWKLNKCLVYLESSQPWMMTLLPADMNMWISWRDNIWKESPP